MEREKMYLVCLLLLVGWAIGAARLYVAAPAAELLAAVFIALVFMRILSGDRRRRAKP